MKEKKLVKKQEKKECQEKDPYEEILEMLDDYEEGLVPRDTTDYEM